MGKYDEIIEDVLVSLSRKSFKLQLLALYLILMTVLNISILFLSLIKYIHFNPIYGVIILCLIIMFGFFFDMIKKNGNAIFEELSDMLHGKNILENKEKKNNFALDARIVMRKYTNSLDIPLFPGKYGTAIIIVLNIIMVFLYIQLNRY